MREIRSLESCLTDAETKGYERPLLNCVFWDFSLEFRKSEESQ
jgi:hypothetical protein